MIPFQQQQQQNQFGGYNQNWYGGTMTYAQPNQQQTPPVLNNFLSPEEMAQIQQTPSFPAKLSQTDYLRSICTHKNNNAITIERLNNGNHRCSICGEEFYLFDLNTPDDTVNKICDNMYNLLQSTKTYFLNAPADLKNFYMVLGFIQKIPQLWQTAKKIFEQASNATTFGLQQNYDQNSFQILGNLFGSTMMGNMVPGNGYYYGQPTQVPPMAQMQQPYPQYQQPAPQQQPYPQYQQMSMANPYNGGIPQPPPPPNVAPPPPTYAPQQPTMQQPISSNPIGYVDPSQQQQQTVSMQIPIQNTNNPAMASQPMQINNTAKPAAAMVSTNPNVQQPDPSKTLVSDMKK